MAGFLSGIHLPKLTPQLSKRILKATLSTLVCFILTIIDPVAARLGVAPYLLPLVSVSLHPGRRVGQMMEAVILSCAGLTLGTGWSVLGRFIYQKLYHPDHQSWSLGTLAALDLVTLATIGFLRGLSPRLFIFTILLFVSAHFSFMANLDISLGFAAKSFSAPSAMAIAICLAFNVVLFPEFGSTYVGKAMISHLTQLSGQLKESIEWFGASDAVELDAIARKDALFNSLSSCKSALLETSFEVTYGHVSPHELKPLHRLCTRMTANVAAILNAWQLEKLSEDKAKQVAEESLKIRRDMSRLSLGSTNAMAVVCQSICFAYDIETRLFNWRPRHTKPTGTHVEVKCESGDSELVLDPSDPRYATQLIALCVHTKEQLEQLLDGFHETVRNSGSLLLDRLQHSEHGLRDTFQESNDIFLTSSLLLNLESAVCLQLECLDNAAQLVAHRAKQKRRRFWFFKLNQKTIASYFRTGYKAEGKEVDLATDPQLLKTQRVFSKNSHNMAEKSDDSADMASCGPDSDGQGFMLPRAAASHHPQVTPLMGLVDDKMKPVLVFMFKYLVLLELVTFPAYVTYMRSWFLNIYGLWVGYVANLVFETSIGGTAVFVLIRALGLAIGSSVGYGAYAASEFHPVAAGRVVMCVILVPLFLVGFYVQLGTIYTKSAMICIVSAPVVILSVVHPNIPGTILENYAKRLISMVVGGTAAVAVQVMILPTRARWLMVDQVSSALTITITMLHDLHESQHFTAVYDEKRLSVSEKRSSKKWKIVARTLTLASSYRNLANKEPRLKQPFSHVSSTWKQIIAQSQQLADMILNACLLAGYHDRENGEFDIDFDYRDVFPNHAKQLFHETLAAVDVCLEAVQSSLNLKRPLPQHLPSAHMAHMRQIAVENETILATDWRPAAAVRWSARKMAMAHVIASLDRLIDLTRELRGSEEFLSGLLSTNTCIQNTSPTVVRRVVTSPHSAAPLSRTLSKLY